MTVSCDAVFVLDDDPVVLGALHRELQSRGHAVETFRSSASFFDRIAGPVPDGCLVLELCLREESGLAIQDKLAQRGCPLPIVFMSGRADVRSTARAMRSGAIDVLVKPLRSRELFEAVARALEAGRQKRAQEAERDRVVQRLAALTPREREVCTHVAAGRLNKQIAADLGTTEKTVKVHRGRAMAKLELGSVAELVRLIDRVSEARPARG